MYKWNYNNSKFEYIQTMLPTHWYDNDCEAGPDGAADLTVKFDTQKIVRALGTVNDGDEVELTLTARMRNGSKILGKDIVSISFRSRRPKESWEARGEHKRR